MHALHKLHKQCECECAAPKALSTQLRTKGVPLHLLSPYPSSFVLPSCHPAILTSLLASLPWPESVTEMLYTDKQQISIVCNLAKLLSLLQLLHYAPPGSLRDFPNPNPTPPFPKLPLPPPGASLISRLQSGVRSWEFGMGGDGRWDRQKVIASLEHFGYSGHCHQWAITFYCNSLRWLLCSSISARVP